MSWIFREKRELIPRTAMPDQWRLKLTRRKGIKGHTTELLQRESVGLRRVQRLQFAD